MFESFAVNNNVIASCKDLSRIRGDKILQAATIVIQKPKNGNTSNQFHCCHQCVILTSYSALEFNT